MKTGIHPDYKPTTIVCSCGNTIETRSTQDEIHVEICAVCHPFYTGRQKLVDTAGRVERFKRKYGEVGSGKPDEVPDVDPSRAEEEAREALAEEAESEEASDEKPQAVTEETAAEAPPEEAEEEEADAAAEEPEASAEEESEGEEAEESEDEDEEEK